MLLSTVELITEASWSSHFVFCFCNIIIVLLLIDRAISSLFSRASNLDPLPFNLNSNAGHIYGSRIVLEDEIVEGPSIEGVGETEAKEEATIEGFSMEGKEATGTKEAAEVEEEEEEGGGEEAAEEEDDDDDEEEEKEDLRKRIEEFIQKVNQAWQEEKLKQSSLIWQ